MPGRNYQANYALNYRYSINGQEKAAELNENITSAEYWQYDSRLGRRWNIDPKPNTSISPYNCFAGNPILYNDVLGDSIGPGRNKGFNVFLVGKTRDFGSGLSYDRLKATQDENPQQTILIETDNLNEEIATNIIKLLGKDGYINTMVMDYHRSGYDDMKGSNKDKFYKKLRNGFTGDKTNVLLGMCWAGGGPTIENKDHPDLTQGISTSLDKATVFGLNTEANNVSFYFRGNFGKFNPYYAFTSGHVSDNENKMESVWTITKYSPQLKMYTNKKVHENINLSIDGKIIRNPIKNNVPNSAAIPYENTIN